MNDLVLSIVQSQIGQAIIIAALTAFGGRLVTARGRVVWAVSHQHSFRIPRPDGQQEAVIRTQEVWIQNAGRAPVENVVVVLNYKPEHYEVWSPREYHVATLASGRLQLTFPRLAGRAFFRLSMIDSIGEIPDVLSIEWQSGTGKVVPMAPIRILPRWVYFALWILIIAGATAVLYLLLRFGIYIWGLGTIKPPA